MTSDLMAAAVRRVYADALIGRCNPQRMEWAMSMCLGCNEIEEHPKVLRDGRVVCNKCEAWRAECEARMVARIASTQQRREYLDSVERKRGKAAADALRAGVQAEWPHRHEVRHA